MLYLPRLHDVVQTKQQNTNTKIVMKKTLTLITMSLIAMTAMSHADDEVKKSALPKDIAAKFDQLAGKDKIKKYEVEKGKDGKVEYEAKIITATGEKEIKLDASGKVIEIEKEMEPKDLPEVVLKAIEKAYPKSEIEEAEHVIAGDSEFYEIELEDADDNDIELKVSVTGKILSAEKEDEDEDDDE